MRKNAKMLRYKNAEMQKCRNTDIQKFKNTCCCSCLPGASLPSPPESEALRTLFRPFLGASMNAGSGFGFSASGSRAEWPLSLIDQLYSKYSKYSIYLDSAGDPWLAVPVRS